MIENLTRAHYDALLRHDFTTFAAEAASIISGH
jgi:hypothetical protein